jgi:hypothetical protein
MYLLVLERKYLKEITGLLNRKDVRSVRKWCNKNQISIHKDISGEFVYESDFELAYNLPMINQLKSTYGDDWQSVYEAHQNNSLYTMLDDAKASQSAYKPMGKVTSNLITKLKSYTNE